MGENQSGNQIITATINLQGRQNPVINTHGTGGPGSMITLIIGGLLLTMYDQDAVRTYHQVWTTWEAKYWGPQLPEHQAMQQPAQAAEPTISVRARGADRSAAAPAGDGRLIVRTDRLTWVAHDRTAYDEQVQTWHTINTLAQVVLPPTYDSIRRGPNRR